MSITGPTSRDAESGHIHTAAGETCFFCGTATADPGIHWMGATTEIFLHLGCTVDLVLRLARDVHQWQREGGHYFGRK